MRLSWSAIALLLCLCATAAAATETQVLPESPREQWPEGSAVNDNVTFSFANHHRIDNLTPPQPEATQDETSVAIPLPPAIYTGLATLSLLGGYVLRRRIRRR